MMRKDIYDSVSMGGRNCRSDPIGGLCDLPIATNTHCRESQSGFVSYVFDVLREICARQFCCAFVSCGYIMNYKRIHVIY